MALIQPFRKLSVKRKLQAIIMSTVIAALLLSCGALLVSQAVGLRGSMKANLQILARMIVENSTAALSFEDRPQPGNSSAALTRSRRYARPASIQPMANCSPAMYASGQAAAQTSLRSPQSPARSAAFLRTDI